MNQSISLANYIDEWMTTYQIQVISATFVKPKICLSRVDVIDSD